MKKEEIKLILSAFFTWRIWLFVFLMLGIFFLPLQKNFIGGGLAKYSSNPFLWSWANFDGEHYISIAQRGYGNLEQSFFPIYPMLIKIIGSFFGSNLRSLNVAGLLISNIAFLIAIFGFYKLILKDYKSEIAHIAVFLLLLFPTSFYFGSVYPTSLFLALVVWSFLFAREGKWIHASFLGTIASVTWVEGILLFPALGIELFLQKKGKIKFIDFIPLFLIILGLLTYTYYLYRSFGDPLAFIHNLPSFGEQRSSVPIILPQVFYRYVFKILPNLNYLYFPSIFSTYLEFFTAIVFLVLSLFSFLKLRLSYSIFLLLGYITPTLSGSFSSLSRYVLVLFPAFIFLSLYISKLSKFMQIFIFLILFIFLAIATALFTRGFWLA